jgi:hypothetical protein
MVPILNFLIKFFFVLISTFCKLWLQMRRKRLKKNGKSFFMNVSWNFIRQPSKGFHKQVVKIVVPYCPCSLKLWHRVSFHPFPYSLYYPFSYWRTKHVLEFSRQIQMCPTHWRDLPTPLLSLCSWGGKMASSSIGLHCPMFLFEYSLSNVFYYASSHQ